MDVMSDTISVRKLRRILEALLDWRYARPIHNNPGTQTEFSRGYETFAKDLHRELDKLESKDDQRSFYRKKK